MRYFIIIFAAVHFFSSILLAQLDAFPGAEGSGRYSTGGRFGAVYEVTNLNNNGAGSIVDACSKPNRTIVFRVSGTIALGSVILQPKSNTTIAGQTAPGDGICIKGRIVLGTVSNIVIRYIRVRVDEGAANSSGDAIDISSAKNVVIDHVTASYARDEGISCQEQSNFITVQWCLISESLTFESHSYGSLVRGDYGDEKSYHHNLYAHTHSRTPRPGNYTKVATDTVGLLFDFRNNVIYNWKGDSPSYNADTDARSRYNFIGNVYIPGIESGSNSNLFKEDSYVTYGHFADNMVNGTVAADPWSFVKFNGFTAAQISAYKARSYLIPMRAVTTTSAAQAKIDVLATVGASFPKRDTIDRRIINDVLTKKGRSIVNTAAQPEGAWPLLNSLPAPADSDRDGMPDSWETAKGLNPSDSTDRNTLAPSGYTMLEEYLNGLVSNPVGIQEAGSRVPAGYTLSQNYPNPFNPSTSFEYTLPREGFVSIKVYNSLGNEIATLANGIKTAGVHTHSFNGAGLPSGTYFYSMRSGSFSSTRKFVLLK